jgi:hypothetical protein
MIVGKKREGSPSGFFAALRMTNIGVSKN